METSVILESYEDFLDFQDFSEDGEMIEELILYFMIEGRFSLPAYWGKQFYSLRVIVFPDNLEIVPFGCFEGHENLAEIHFGKNLAKLSENSFKECTQLNILQMQHLKSIESHVFNNSLDGVFLVMPSNLYEILSNGFEECLMTKIDLSHTFLFELKNETFAQCYNLREILLPEKLEIIEELCFANCYSLEVIKFPLSLFKIGNLAFFNCYKLKDIVLPAFLNKLGMRIFLGCKNLKDILIMGKKRFLPLHFEIYQRIVFVDQGEVIQQNE
jgi:hypothetical protein